MKKYVLITLVAIVNACVCTCGKNNENKDPDPEPPKFTLDSYNGQFAQRIAEAYDTFEETGALPVRVNVEGLEYNKGKYILAACMLMDKIATDPEHWQDQDIEIPPAAFGDEYRWNTYDPDEIDMPHVFYLAKRLLAYSQDPARSEHQLPNYVTFPSTDPSAEGYMPQLTMVVTRHDNLMNLVTSMVVLTRVFNYFVKNEGVLPEKVSAWPASYLGSVSNCPIDDPVVIAARDEAIKGLPADATDRQKAEAIYKYARDAWEWENYMNTRKGAVGTIKAKGGNCCDLTHATVAMCRASGIPARYLHGQCYYSSVTGHVIPEIYADGKWWIADPTNNDSTWGTPKWKGMETFNGRYNQLEF